MDRRAFLGTIPGGAAIPLLATSARPSLPLDGRILTVSGPIDPSLMGTTLVHEHVLVDFAGAEKASRARYDAQEVFAAVLPQLQQLAARGCRTLVECTPAFLGRDPLLLQRLSRASGLQIVTNTGYYGAANDIAVPAHAYSETARQLAGRWTVEARHGLEGSGIRPGFVKIGVDPGPLSAIDRKLVEAGALCHLDTGLTLAIHTGDGEAALAILDVLDRSGVSPEAWIWVHAGNARGYALHTFLADRGAWVELDKLSPQSLAEHVEAVVEMHGRNRLDRVLVSQDAGWYHVGEPGGGSYRPHTFLFDEFLPALRARGLGEREVRTLLVDNPARAFTVRVRPARG